jgi:uncharacterized protein involved in exopolysaccharide biosynthesis
MVATQATFTSNPESSDRHQTTAPKSVNPKSSAQPARPEAAVTLPKTLAVSAAIALTSGTAAHLIAQPPLHEGRVQIKLQAVTSGAASAQSTAQSTIQSNVVPDIIQPISAIFDPAQNAAIQSLTSRELLEPVVQSLQKHKLNLRYEQLVANLTITPNANGSLDILYRDADPHKVGLVLDRLSQHYINYGKTCATDACKGMRVTRQNLTQLKAEQTEAQKQLRTFQQQQSIESLNSQSAAIATRLTQVKQQSAEVQRKLKDTQQQYDSLQQRLGSDRNTGIAQAILDQDDAYQTRLALLRKLETQLIDSYSTLQSDQLVTRTLYEQHQEALSRANQSAREVLERYISQPGMQLTEAVYQEAMGLQLLQQSIGALHYMDVLQLRRDTIVASEQNLAEKRQQLVSLVNEHKTLQQKVETQAKQLQQTRERFASLQRQAPQLGYDMTVIAPPELIEEEAKQSAAALVEFTRKLATGTIVASLFGVGLAVVLERRRQVRLMMGDGVANPFIVSEPVFEMPTAETTLKQPKTWVDTAVHGRMV